MKTRPLMSGGRWKFSSGTLEKLSRAAFKKANRELGREPINLPGGRLARARYAPFCDQILQRS